MKQDSIVFFDGVCNLCNGAVKFLLNIDTKKKLRFASLQSPRAEKILKHSVQTSTLDSIVYLKNGQEFKKSSACLEIAKDMGRFWQILYIFILIPRPIRDFIYDAIAVNRYRLFGKKNTCMRPSSSMKDQFLHD